MTRSSALVLATLCLGVAGCNSAPVASLPEPAPKAPPAAAQGATQSVRGPGDTTEDGPAATGGARKEDGAPNLSGETECVIARWSTVEPAWRRDTAKWNAQTSTLELPDTERHLNAQGRVQDFGDGTDHLEYDKAGNIVSRTAGKAGTGVSYRYDNKYDAKGRLLSVAMASKPREGAFGKLEPYRSYSYDAQGRLVGFAMQTIPHNPLVPARIEWDEHGRLRKITWGEPDKPVVQTDTFGYDDAGRLVDYARDGLIIARGKPADGVVEWTQHWEYGPNGFPNLLDSVEGLDAKRAPHEQTRWSAACAEIGKRWQDIYVYPYLALPAALVPRFAGQ